MPRITPFKIGKKFVKVGDWIRFGYKKCWHTQSNNHISTTENIGIVVSNDFATDGWGKRIGPLVVKYNTKFNHGFDLGQVIAEYSNPYGSSSAEDGAWQYSEPYIEFYKHEQKTKRSKT